MSDKSKSNADSKNNEAVRRGGIGKIHGRVGKVIKGSDKPLHLGTSKQHNG